MAADDALAGQTRRLRILHGYKVFRPDIEGGIPAVIASLIQDRRQDHSVLTARLSGAGRRFTESGAPVRAVGSFGNLFSTPAAPLYIPAICREMCKTDVLVHHAPFPFNDAAILLALPDHVALVVYWHADVLSYPLLRRLVSPLNRHALARADAIVVSGQAMISGCDLLAPHAHKCEVLPYGIDLSAWRDLDADDKEAVARLQQDSPRQIVALGRLVEYKGFDVLIRAMSGVDGQATIIGDGPLRADLERLAEDCGVSDSVHFAGRAEQRSIKVMLHAARAFALPSVTEAEAFGLVQIEAMACGLPIVNTSLPTTVPEVARDGMEALTVPPRDVRALADALNRILDDSALADRLGIASRLRADTEFADHGYRDRIAMVYRKAVAARTAALTSVARRSSGSARR
jgi:rhamnosyl/mannosyltransferase